MAPSELPEQALRVAAEAQAAALSQELAQVRAFAARLDRSFDDECRRLAREVHGQLGQVGPTIKMLAITLHGQLPPHLESLLDDIQQLADDASRSTQQICAALRPPLLDELGLAPALEHQLELLTERTGTATQLDLQGAERLPAATASTLFRLTHGAWTKLLLPMGVQALDVRGQARNNGYEIEIQGQGRFDAAVAEQAGLPDMRERAVASGGSFEFTATDDGSLLARAWLPLMQEEASA